MRKTRLSPSCSCGCFELTCSESATAAQVTGEVRVTAVRNASIVRQNQSAI